MLNEEINKICADIEQNPTAWSFVEEHGEVVVRKGSTTVWLTGWTEEDEMKGVDWSREIDGAHQNVKPRDAEMALFDRLAAVYMTQAA